MNTFDKYFNMPYCHHNFKKDYFNFYIKKHKRLRQNLKNFNSDNKIDKK